MYKDFKFSKRMELINQAKKDKKKYIGCDQLFDTTISNAYLKLKGVPYRQLRIVVKAKSMKEANEICETNNLDVKFKSGWCSETGNKATIELCNKSEIGIVIGPITGTADKYVTYEEIQKVL